MIKKINDMDRDELLTHMRASGEIHRSDKDSNAWKRAFALYQQSQGARVDMDCSTCWGKVSSWLKG